MLEQQQNQISQNEIQKLSNTIEREQNENLTRIKLITQLEDSLRLKDVEIHDQAKAASEQTEALKSANKDKEELTLKCSSLEDKLQKMELDREQQRLKVKQQGQMHAEMEDKIDKLNGEKDAL